jgi:hypothetical protein
MARFVFFQGAAAPRRPARDSLPIMFSGDGGRGGIRTHERVAPLPVFKTGALNHSATRPRGVFSQFANHVQRDGTLLPPSPLPPQQEESGHASFMRNPSNPGSFRRAGSSPKLGRRRFLRGCRRCGRYKRRFGIAVQLWNYQHPGRVSSKSSKPRPQQCRHQDHAWRSHPGAVR